MENKDAMVAKHGKYPGDFKAPTDKQIVYLQRLRMMCRQRGIPIKQESLLTRRDYAIAIGFMKNALELLSQTAKAKQRRAARAARAAAGIPRGYLNKKKHDKGGEAR